MEDPAREPAGASQATPEHGTRPETGSEFRWRPDLLFLGAIVLAAFALRVAFVIQLQASPTFATPVMDALLHDQWARALAAGERFWEGPYFRAPLYPWFLGAVYWLFGSDSALAPRIVQALLGSLSCGLLYLIGRQVFDQVVAVIAGFAAATYWIFLYYDAELLIPVLIVFLDLLLLLLLLMAGQRRNALLWGVCGLVLGLSAIARPNILLFAPVLVAWVFVLHRGHLRRFLLYAGCLFVGTMLPILPITIRNCVVGGEFVLISAQGGVNFYIGNNPDSDGMSAVIKGDPTEWWPCYQAQIERAELAAGRSLGASEVSRWYFGQALRFMREQPGRAAGLLLKKLVYFWSHWEVSNNQDIHFIIAYYAPVARVMPLGFWIVGPLGALGMLLCMRRDQARRLFPLWGFVLVYMISVVAFFVTARYRLPAAAVLILLGSYAAAWCIRTLRAERWRSLIGAAVALTVMGAVTSLEPPRADRTMFQGHRAAGIALATQERWSKAEFMLEEALRRAEATNWPFDAATVYWLGAVKLRQDKIDEALDCFQQVIAADPDYLPARRGLAAAFATTGRMEQAAEQFEHVVRLDPKDGGAHARLGSALAHAGHMDRALEHLLRALEIDADNNAWLMRTATDLRLQGHFERAARLLRSGAERFPDEISLTLALIELLANRVEADARAEAVLLSAQACERTRYRDASVLHVAALAYSNTGQAERAVETERQALEIAAREGQTELADACRQSLRRYEATVRRRSRSPSAP